MQSYKSFLLVFLIALPLAFGAMTINPQKYDIKDIEYNKSYKIIITAVNPDSSMYDVQVMVNRDSYYLLDSISIEPTHFRIGPGENKNVQLSLSIPPGMSPEQHTLILDFLAANLELGKFKLTFTIPGERVEQLEVLDMKEQLDQSIVFFDYRLQNTGNVIARGSPIVEIYRDNVLLDSFGDESQIMIMPGEGYNLSVMYDTSGLQSGDYSYKAKFRYNDLETDYFMGTFKVKNSPSGYSDEVSISQGESLSYSMELKNPASELSFYKVSYTINGISGEVEGQMESAYKDVALNIDTSGFDKGTYDLELEVLTGRKLEIAQSKKVKVTVGSSQSYVWLLIPLVALLAAGYILFPHIRRRVAGRTAGLEKNIRQLGHRFGYLEKNTQAFTRELHSFIHESNAWLKHNGYGNYGFR